VLAEAQRLEERAKLGHAAFVSSSRAQGGAGAGAQGAGGAQGQSAAGSEAAKAAAASAAALWVDKYSPKAGLLYKLNAVDSHSLKAPGLVSTLRPIK
jgi:hypothetical protein